MGKYQNISEFVNPKAPIYVVNGVAGNLESDDIVFDVTDTPDPWIVVIKENLEYGILDVVNRTHLKYGQIGFGESQWDSAFKDFYDTKRVDDYFWIVKNN